MAQMAPALTEANASPGSSRKNSVDRCYSSTVPEELKQGSLSSGVDLKLLSRNGLVRLLEDTDSSNNITNTNGAIREEPSRFFSTPKTTKRNDETLKITDMPNGLGDGDFSKVVESMAKTSNTAIDSQNRKPAIPSDPSQRACASSTTTARPAGACNIESENVEDSRITQHPVATIDSRKAVISKRTIRAIEQQARLENRAKKLEKRLRRLQTRQIAGHVQHQLSGIINQQREKNEIASCSTKQGGHLTSGDLFVGKKADSRDGLAKEPVSSNTLQSLESDKSVTAKGSRNASSNNDCDENKFENAIKYSPDSVNKTIRIALIEEKQKYEAESLSEGLRAHVEHLEAMYDSDATEASSGDESEDEDYLSSSLHSKTSKYLRKQYLCEKGEIASQWSWLQSQIINLERQIRRYEDLHRSVRLAKQPVKLQSPVSFLEVKNSTSPYMGSMPCGQPLLNNLPPKSPQTELKSIFKEPENHLRNGVKKDLLQESAVDDSETSFKKLRTKLLKNDTNDNKYSVHVSNGDILQCARTRAAYPVTRRPLVRLPWMQLKCKSKKSFCQCSLPETRCLSCCRLSKTIPVTDAAQRKAERVALLDQSFHPVLSYNTEIPLQFHFGSLLKKGGFESRTQPTKPQPIKATSRIDKKKNHQTKSQRRAQLAKGAAASLLSSAKYRNSRYERKRGYTSLPSTPKNAKHNEDRECHTDVIPRKKRAAAISAAAQLQKRARSLSLPCTGSSPSTPTSSPSPTPPLSNSLPPSSLSLMLRKKRANNAFDINNIVIPYSMASSTRVEKLQYKEIPTPSWRLLEISTEDIKKEEKEEEECLDEDIMAMRHDICEEHERKRFLGFLTKKRKRSSRQSSETSNADGGVDSQAANTPPGTPLLHSPSPTSAGIPGNPASAITPSFQRSFSLDSRLSHRRSSSTESLQRASEGEIWPVVNPWPERTFPLSEAEEAALKLPTPMPTPIPSRATSPSPVSLPGSPMCSPLASPASVDSNETYEEKNEWTVKLVTTDNESGSGDQPRKGIVLKLAKR